MKKIILLILAVALAGNAWASGSVSTCRGLVIDFCQSDIVEFRKQSKICDDYEDMSITVDGTEKLFTIDDFLERLGFFQTTEIIVILDRSGSMENMEKDMEGGLNKFVTDQKEIKGKAYFSLAQFDSEYELVYDSIDIQNICKIDLVPRNRTALLDAIGKTLDKTYRNNVICVIITDGLENASTEYDKSTIITMIESRKKCGWKFIYLGANQDAIQEGSSLGINYIDCSTFDSTNVNSTIDTMSVQVSGFRIDPNL